MKNELKIVEKTNTTIIFDSASLTFWALGRASRIRPYIVRYRGLAWSSSQRAFFLSCAKKTMMLMPPLQPLLSARTMQSRGLKG
jgi:hypothetical protein